MKKEDAELRIPGDSPCSCSSDCDRYILALEADLREVERDRDAYQAAAAHYKEQRDALRASSGQPETPLTEPDQKNTSS